MRRPSTRWSIFRTRNALWLIVLAALGSLALFLYGQRLQAQRIAGPDVYYANCAEANAAGVDPINRGEPGFRDDLDRDHDGIACEPRR